MALEPSINAFGLLESDEPGDVGAPAKVDDAASRPVNINKKQQPQMSVWKANKVKAEANAAKNKQQQLQQPAASKAKAKANSSAANAAGKYKKPQQPAATRAQATKTAANAAANGQFQQHQHSPAPVNLTQILFGNAYPSARGLIYKNRTQSAAANAKDGGAGGATTTTDDKTSVHANGAATKKHDGPAPVQEEPAAPVKPLLPPAPAPSLDDSAQFPSLN